MKKEETEKFKWTIALGLTFLCFLYGLFTQNILIQLLVMLSATLIYKNGNKILFKEQEEKRKRRIEESMKLKEATKEIIREKRFIKG